MKNQIKNKPLISVIVPVYNVEKYLATCLNSIIKQSYLNLEIICVNDGSTDGSKKIIDEYCQKYKMIKVIDQKNAGLSSARNAGLDSAEGEYILFVDSDDWLEGEIVEHVSQVMLENGSLDFVAFGMKGYDEKESHYCPLYLYQYEKELAGQVLDSAYLQRHFFKFNASACDKLFNRNFLNQHQLRFREGIIHEEVIFYIDMAMVTQKFSFIEQQGYVYRINRSGAITEKFNAICHARMDTFEYLFDVLYRHPRINIEQSTIWAKIFNLSDDFYKKLSKIDSGIFYERIRNYLLLHPIDKIFLNNSPILSERNKEYLTCETYEEKKKKEKQRVFKKVIKKNQLRYYFFGFRYKTVIDKSYEN